MQNKKVFLFLNLGGLLLKTIMANFSWIRLEAKSASGGQKVDRFVTAGEVAQNGSGIHEKIYLRLLRFYFSLFTFTFSCSSSHFGPLLFSPLDLRKKGVEGVSQGEFLAQMVP